MCVCIYIYISIYICLSLSLSLIYIYVCLFKHVNKFVTPKLYSGFRPTFRISAFWTCVLRNNIGIQPNWCQQLLGA